MEVNTRHGVEYVLQHGVCIALVGVLLLLVPTADGISNSTRYKNRGHYRIHADIVDDTMTASSVIHCTSLCTSYSNGCNSVSYSASVSTDNCYLSSTSLTPDPWYNDAKLVSNASWTTMLMIVYPVTNVIGGTSNYNLTYEQAKDACTTFGTELASEADVMSARANGFSWCSCGWTTDGTIGFILQEANSDCWYTYHTGFLRCQGHETNGKANAWCKSY